MPLEAVWHDSRLDTQRTRRKIEVSTGYTRFRNGDVLVPKVTPTFQAGRSAIMDRLPAGVGAGSTELHVLRPKHNVDARFLRYVVQSTQFLTEGATHFQGVAGLQRVPDEFIRNYPIAEFSLNEQRRIADFLDVEVARIEDMCSVRTRQLSLVESRRVAAIEEVFESMQSTSKTRLKYLLRARPRYGVLVPEFVDQGIPFVRINDLSNLVPEDLPQIPRSLSAQYKRTVLEDGDLLVSVVGTLGRSKIVRSSLVGANVNRPIAVLRPLSTVSVELLEAWVSSGSFARQASDVTASDSAQRTLGMEDLCNFSVMWPSDASEQRSMVGSVHRHQDETDRLSFALKRQLRVLMERRQSLIAGAVTGQLDVTTAQEPFGHQF